MLLIGFTRRSKKRKKLATANTTTDLLKTSLTALKESSDAFPPLKSAVGAVLVVHDLAERTKHSKSKARAISLRTTEILELVADALPDPTHIPLPLLQTRSLERFTNSLESIQRRMRDLSEMRGLSRLTHLSRNERMLEDIIVELDDAYSDLLAASILRIEARGHAFPPLQGNAQADELERRISKATEKLTRELKMFRFLLFVYSLE